MAIGHQTSLLCMPVHPSRTKSDKKKIVPDEIIISKDRKSVQVKISVLEKRKIYQFSVMGVRNQTGQSLRNSTAHYTLNELPDQ